MKPQRSRSLLFALSTEATATLRARLFDAPCVAATPMLDGWAVQQTRRFEKAKHWTMACERGAVVGSTTFNRSCLRIAHDDNGCDLEITIDEGRFETPAACRPLREVKIKFIRGDRAAIFSIARRLHAIAPMRLEPVRRAERIARLVRGEWGQPAGKRTPDINAHMSIGEAYQAIMRACLAQLSLNLSALVEAAHDSDIEIEAVHQARVALRRARAANTLFAPALRDDAFVLWRQELRSLSRFLGEARDLDTARLRLAMARDELSSKFNADERLARVTRLRDVARERLANYLQSAEMETKMLGFLEWVETGEWLRRRQGCVAPAHDRHVAKLAAHRLSRQSRKLARLANRFDDLDDTELHRLRIDAKKLRYMSEFVGFVDSHKTARRERAKALTVYASLQDRLGPLIDLSQAAPDLASPLEGSEIKELWRRARRSAREALGLEPYWRNW